MCAPLLVTPGATGQQPPKGDLGMLQGYWSLRGFECEMRGTDIDPGGPQPSPDVVPLLRCFGIERYPEEATVVLRVQGKYLNSVRGTELFLRQVFEPRLDEGKCPRTINLIFDTPSGPKSIPGIYKLEGDKFTLCVAIGDRRPTEFKTAAGQVLFHYDRSK
jgi:uncharacterized protein (TIGR03067 family)